MLPDWKLYPNFQFDDIVFYSNQRSSMFSISFVRSDTVLRIWFRLGRKFIYEQKSPHDSYRFQQPAPYSQVKIDSPEKAQAYLKKHIRELMIKKLIQ